MATRILGPTGSKKRRRFLLVPILLVACTALFLVGSAQAVHDQKFQLDGDVSTHCYTVPNNCSTQAYDWGGNGSNASAAQTDAAHGLFVVADNAATSTETVTPNPALVPDVFASATFVRDFQSGSSCALNSTSTTFCTSDDTTYATGSKDTLGIGNGGWQCNHDANVNSKIDIMNGYVASYIDPANGDHIIYFGLEKNKNNGTNDVGIWFLQSNADCSVSKGHKNWTGSHSDGDVLVVSEFSQGGGVSTVKAFRWAAAASGPLSGDGGCIDSNDNPDPKLGGCNQLEIGSGQDCKSSPTGSLDALCATTNATCTDATKPCSLPWNDNVTTPWLTSDATLGVGHTAVPPDFFEGGINITREFQGKGGTTPSCFNVIVPDTRSSASPTATLFDYVLNRIGECKGSLSTQENAASSREIGANGTIDSGTDTAELKISGTPIWGGHLSWYLCGPGVTSCDNTGYAVDGRDVSNADNNGCGADCSYDSGTVTLTKAGVAGAGEYCWHAHFEPDAPSALAGVKPQDDDGTNECFFVTPKTPTLTTSASCGATPCVLGSTLTDYAQLSGTANNPKNDGTNTKYPSIGGTTQPADSSITWTLYGPASDGTAQCLTPIANAPTPATKTVSGDSTGLGYGPVNYVTSATDKVGTYTFAASYPGEGPNTTAPTSQVTCANGATDGEQVTVTGTATSSSAQRWLPNDRVVLGSTAGTTLHGNLTVTLYKGAFGGTASNCTVGTGVAVSGQSYGPITVSTATNSFTYNTTNSTFVVGTNSDGTTTGAGTDGTYFWLIHYVDTSLTSPNDRCETSTISHNDG